MESNEKSISSANGGKESKQSTMRICSKPTSLKQQPVLNTLLTAKKLKIEGYPQIAMLFKATSTAEMVHANNHKAVLQELGQSVPNFIPEFMVRSTAENLKDALAGESDEITNIYPAFMKNANDAGNQLAVVSLVYAYKTELKHKVFYENALAALKNKDVQSLPLVYYVCPTCGNTYDTIPPKRCGISLTSSEKFITIDNVNS